MNCPRCAIPVTQGARFCSNCGATISAEQPTLPTVGKAHPWPEPKHRIASRPLRIVLRLLVLAMMITGVVSFVVLVTKGCSSTEGSLVSTGQPLGDLDFKPTQCKSGEHEGFYGVFLLPEADNRGGLKVVQDAVRNTWVIHFEIPGSCSPTCKVVTIDQTKCTTYDVAVQRTNTTVNDIRLLDGRLNLNCKFEQGSASAKIAFEGCD